MVARRLPSGERLILKTPSCARIVSRAKDLWIGYKQLSELNSTH
jgi:hypothetical protein